MNEFRRHRQVLAALYLVAIGGAGLLLAASVGHQLLFPPVPEARGPNLALSHPDPHDLLECNRKVLYLYEELGRVTNQLLAAPTRGDDRDLQAAWVEFERAWIGDWHHVAARCRFAEPAGADAGEAHKKMAAVHADLRTMRLKYHDLVAQFATEQAGELGRMKRALAEARVALERGLGQTDRTNHGP